MSDIARRLTDKLIPGVYEPGVPRSQWEKAMEPGPDSSLPVVAFCALSVTLACAVAIFNNVQDRSYWRMAIWLLLLAPSTVWYCRKAWRVLPGLWERRGQSDGHSAP